MIFLLSKIEITDNSGGKIGQCIKVYNSSRKAGAFGGDKILVTIKKRNPHKKVKQGELYKALILRSARIKFDISKNGLKFNKSSIVLINDKNLPIGTRIFGPTYKELRLNYMKIVSLSSNAI